MTSLRFWVNQWCILIFRRKNRARDNVQTIMAIPSVPSHERTNVDVERRVLTDETESSWKPAADGPTVTYLYVSVPRDLLSLFFCQHDYSIRIFFVFLFSQDTFVLIFLFVFFLSSFFFSFFSHFLFIFLFFFSESNEERSIFGGIVMTIKIWRISFVFLFVRTPCFFFVPKIQKDRQLFVRPARVRKKPY